MKEFCSNLTTTWWGILIICVVCAIVWIVLSALLYRVFFKRFYDILLSGIAIIVLSPLLLLLIILGAIKMKGNPFFVQKRPGRRKKLSKSECAKRGVPYGTYGEEKIIKLLKFRTMTNEKDAEGNFLPDEVRLNKYGRLLRKTSCDELPSLINIFKGDLSIVGPRPLAVSYLPYYTDEERMRHNVRPGLTGLAQVNGRTAIGWDKRLSYDLSYVKNISLITDIKIILLTVKKVLKASDIVEAVGQTDFYDYRIEQWNEGAVARPTTASRVRGKRLLILGGSALEITLVERAKQLGVYTIVTDYYDTDVSPAKKIADEYWDISWSDIDALEKKCRKNNVDGVLAGYSEFRVENLIKLCNRLHLPCYLNDEQLDITRNKDKFKAVCRKNGVPVVREYKSIDEVTSYPIIVKPVDRGGSIGVGIAHNRDELISAYDYAMEKSVCKKVIIEDYIQDGIKFDVYYAILNGKPILLSTDDTFMSAKGSHNRVIQNGWVFPSRYTDLYLSGVNKPVENMICDLGIKNGYIFLSGFALPDGNFVFFETGFRLSGEEVYVYTDAEGLTNVFDLLIQHALCGHTVGISENSYNNSMKKCVTVNYYANAGVIKSITGVDKISSAEDCILSVVLANAGDECDDTNAILHKLAMFSFVNSNPENLSADVKTANELFAVTDNNGADLVYDGLDAEPIKSWWDGTK
ncbi:MAG: sugar transferase [Clostridiales bacterium]|nr:sugar transferase [Clostridiales bacterium]